MPINSLAPPKLNSGEKAHILRISASRLGSHMVPRGKWVVICWMSLGELTEVNQKDASPHQKA